MTQPDADDVEVIEGFYDWGPGVVVTADCLGQSYQTALTGRQLTVTLPAFDGNTLAEPPCVTSGPTPMSTWTPPTRGVSCAVGTKPKTDR